MAQLKKLEEYADDIYSCMRCGFCIKCPLYEGYGWASNIARGRIQIARGILENRLEFSEYIAEKTFSCTTCEYCLIFCPSGIPTTEIIKTLKRVLAENNYGPSSLGRILENIRREGNPYGEPRSSRGSWLRDEHK
ncbi:MAG: 4Fe-4S dicluster domain-containing protein [Candidatus Freyrarchaeum guaymaensis]|nr:(Fe-S)-binding protein [Candidatus Sigynarchaeota archaeon]